MTVLRDPAPDMRRRFLRGLRRFWTQLDLQLMILPGILFLAVFAYSPMYGILIAFNNYKLTGPILNSDWTGFKYFEQFLTNKAFMSALQNTILINLLNLAIVFPIPIIFSLLLNEVRSPGFKRLTQSVSYLPHFLSWVIFGGMFINLLAQDTGAINALLVRLGFISEPVLWLGNPNYFYAIAVLTSLIKGLGWSAVIYLAAITGVDQELYDAAKIDGAGRFQCMLNITLPSITGVIVIMLIFSISGLLNSGFDQMFILQNKLNISASEVIDTYVYKVGIREMRFSYAAAVGLSRSVVAFILLFIANFVANRITGKGLF
ncbi:MAG: ABC transporter permease subunit [Oscillospiraceae bacterium]|nr:ABC transporter permease subunit [Oscillospiraceae bacterium]